MNMGRTARWNRPLQLLPPSVLLQGEHASTTHCNHLLQLFPPRPLAHNWMPPWACVSGREVLPTSHVLHHLRQSLGATAGYSTTSATVWNSHQFLNRPRSLATHRHSPHVSRSCARCSQPMCTLTQPCACGSPLACMRPWLLVTLARHFTTAGFLNHICLANLPTASFLSVLGHAARLSLLRQIFPRISLSRPVSILKIFLAFFLLAKITPVTLSHYRAGH